MKAGLAVETEGSRALFRQRGYGMGEGGAGKVWGVVAGCAVAGTVSRWGLSGKTCTKEEMMKKIAFDCDNTLEQRTGMWDDG